LQLQDLSKLSLNEFTPQFRTELRSLQEAILRYFELASVLSGESDVHAKRTPHGLLTGTNLAMLIKFLVSASIQAWTKYPDEI
jgi:hypothetical protein